MKTIVILSTEPWGKMLLSKMHYAKELANAGHNVFFVNPPGSKKQKKLVCINDDSVQAFTIIDTKIIKGSLFLRYKLFFLYRLISLIYIKGIKKIVNKKIDEVWSFDPHLYVDLRFFKAPKHILFLYDLYKEKYVFKTAQTSDAIISISKVILDHFSCVNKPKLLLQHGLNEHFSDLAKKRLLEEKVIKFNNPIKVGYVGNLLRGGMDINITQQVIQQNPEVEFNFWGPYSFKDNNVSDYSGSIDSSLIVFINLLKVSKNVILHGVKGQQDLAFEMFKMDAFLFLYNAAKDVNAASNSHKIVEYLSTGKVIISTYVSNYADNDLLVMCEKNKEDQLPALFKTVTGNLSSYNSANNQQSRITYALNNTYKLQIDRIHNFIY